jgi:hypothetical protein
LSDVFKNCADEVLFIGFYKMFHSHDLNYTFCSLFFFSMISISGISGWGIVCWIRQATEVVIKLNLFLAEEEE